MKTRLISILMLAALTMTVGACSSDDDDTAEPTVPTAPIVPEYLKEGTDSRPVWTVAQVSYEFYMTVQVQLGDTLSHFQSPQDLMCATINGEVHAVTGLLTTGGVGYFPLTIGATDASGMISLQYYCDRLHRIYTINNWASFDPSAKPTGESDFYRPRFTEGK